MMLQSTSTQPPRRPPLRLRYTIDADESRGLDGAWWPYGDDLVAELPALLATFEPGFGAIYRMVYCLGEWSNAPKAFNTAEHRVRLDGYRHRPAHTIGLLGSGGRAIALLIVPPRTNGELARAAMSAAADPTCTATVADLMAMTARSGDAETDVREQRWESEGGAGRY
ncbi:hypothetical protein IU429_13135 [Nocardia elegans]|uniref:DUF5994 family protein n=1 Tax=Nocardia elegans TaxID=300029 RepID=A0ABW6T946_9NOCA|nr:DUF5994 family protein [Nocardia elegans]MBF6448611.1 hypothetical protein [Nocardia elegans]